MARLVQRCARSIPLGAMASSGMILAYMHAPCQWASGPVIAYMHVWRHSSVARFLLRVFLLRAHYLVVLHCATLYTLTMSQYTVSNATAAPSQGAQCGHGGAGGAIMENTSMSKGTPSKAMTKKAANEVVGRFSDTEKMPCLSWSTPTSSCITGAKLAKVPGSVCFGCYAMKGRYRFSTTQNALSRRLEALQRAMVEPAFRAQFVSAFVTMLEGAPFFRWHDSGDLQGHGHLALICDIARALPGTKFWLPTREYAIVNTYLDAIPSNLVIRVSAHKIDGAAPAGFSYTSTVHGKGRAFEGVECKAATRANKAKKIGPNCGTCRACWSPEVKNISYPIH